ALDAKGNAVVVLPKGVADHHGEFSYQLTSIGGPAPNLHIAQQIKGGKFTIAGGAGKTHVSWQVTGIPKSKPVAVKHTNEQVNAKELKRHRDQMEAYATLVEKNRRPKARAK